MLQSRTWLDVGRCHARMVGLFMSRTARDGCDLAGILWRISKKKNLSRDCVRGIFYKEVVDED